MTPSLRASFLPSFRTFLLANTYFVTCVRTTLTPNPNPNPKLLQAELNGMGVFVNDRKKTWEASK